MDSTNVTETRPHRKRPTEDLDLSKSGVFKIDRDTLFIVWLQRCVESVEQSYGSKLDMLAMYNCMDVPCSADGVLIN